MRGMSNPRHTPKHGSAAPIHPDVEALLRLIARQVVQRYRDAKTEDAGAVTR